MSSCYSIGHMPTSAADVTILFDNEASTPGLTALWGFAALIEIGALRILFDTGSNGRVLLRNMAALGLRSDALDMLFLSHAHWDHSGGIDSVLELNERITVVLHDGFSLHFIEDLRRLCGEVIVVGADPKELAPGVFSTGRLDGPPAEHGMVLDVGGISATVAGCAHPGVERIVASGGALLGRPVDWAIGGFHLLATEPPEVDRRIHRLRALGVTNVVPTHCTGEAAQHAFRAAYGEHCHTGGVGRRFALAAPQL